MNKTILFSLLLGTLLFLSCDKDDSATERNPPELTILKPSDGELLEDRTSGIVIEMQDDVELKLYQVIVTAVSGGTEITKEELKTISGSLKSFTFESTELIPSESELPGGSAKLKVTVTNTADLSVTDSISFFL